jgi:hypothetical protein
MGAEVSRVLGERGQRAPRAGTAAPARAVPAFLPALQRAYGNQAAGRYVQRAVGFEFEFGTWQTFKQPKSGKKSRLTKGEEIVKGGGYKVEGEDATSSTSAIEVVTDPFEDQNRAVAAVGEAQGKLGQLRDAFAKLGQKQQPAGVPASTIGGSEDVRIAPAAGLGKFQASPSVPLESLFDFYQKGTGAHKGIANSVRRQLGSKAILEKHLPPDAQKFSGQLEGLVILIVHYFRQGMTRKDEAYPKATVEVMARTSFTKMFTLMPEHDYFGKKENRDKWVDLVMDVAGAFFGGAIGKDPKGGQVLNQTFVTMDNLPADQWKIKLFERQKKYKLKTTREEWLKEMPERDLLAKERDRRFEGMGAYGDSTDVRKPAPKVEEQPKAQELQADAQQQPEADVIKIAEEAGEKAVEQVKAQEGADAPKNDAPKNDAPAEADDEVASDEAPIFEIRGLSDMFGISQDITMNDGAWVAKVKDVYEKLPAEALEFMKGGKPKIPGDRDAPSDWQKV